MTKHIMGIAFAIFASFSTHGLAQTTTQEQASTPSGKELLKINCSRCHAITTHDISHHSDAPAFRNLSKQYPVDHLEEALAEGIFAGHPDMPVFEFERDQVNNIISYLKSIQNQR